MQAQDSVQIVLEILENENNYNAFTFLSIKLEPGHIYAALSFVILAIYGYYELW
jgi:hypothetical protein